MVDQAIAQLNLAELEKTYSGRGLPPHRPDILLRLAVYETMCGVGSPRQWARDARECASLQWLLRGVQPSERTCYRFRDRLASVIETLYNQIIQLARREELLPNPERVGQDGTFHRACASRHRLVNKQQLDKRRQQLEEFIVAQVTGQEPSDPLPYWMPRTPAGSADLLLRMKKAEEVLQQRLKANADRRKSHRLDEKHICVSLSDPESAISRDKEKVFCPLYTAQYMTDYRTGLVLGFHVTATATDVGTLIPMLDKVQPLVGNSIKQVCTDSTYATVLELRACQERNVELIALVQENSWTEKKRHTGAVARSNKQDFRWLEKEGTYQCPNGHHLQFQYKETADRAGGRKVTMHRFLCPPQNCMKCPLAPSCVKDPSRGRTVKRLEGQELLDAQRARMKQQDAKDIHRNRGSVVERTIADIKEHRDGRRLHGRGLQRAKAEIGLMTTAQTILTLQRLRNATLNTRDDTG